MIKRFFQGLRVCGVDDDLRQLIGKPGPRHGGKLFHPPAFFRLAVFSFFALCRRRLAKGAEAPSPGKGDCGGVLGLRCFIVQSFQGMIDGFGCDTLGGEFCPDAACRCAAAMKGRRLCLGICSVVEQARA